LGVPSEAKADRATVIRRLIEGGKYNNPVRVVCFNTSEGWSRDVTEEIAREVRDWADRKGQDLSPALRDWVDWQAELGKRYDPVAWRHRRREASVRFGNDVLPYMIGR
jgi:hypothetical protein